MRPNRPVGVTVVAVLGIVTGILQILTGTLLVVAGLPTIGVIGQVVGVITLIVAVYLLRGSRLARLLVTVDFVVSILQSVFAALQGGSTLTSALIAIVLLVIGLVLLWSGRAHAFFRDEQAV